MTAASKARIGIALAGVLITVLGALVGYLMERSSQAARLAVRVEHAESALTSLGEGAAGHALLPGHAGTIASVKGAEAGIERLRQLLLEALRRMDAMRLELRARQDVLRQRIDRLYERRHKQ